MKNFLLCFVVINYILFSQSLDNLMKTDPLSETPLYPIPLEMSFDEYQDMNRRLSQGIFWSSIPIPGITHYYAGDKKTAKRLFYIGIGGFACVIGGAISMGESKWPEYNENIHIIHNPGDDERRYEKVPVSVEGDVISYNLREIYREQDGNGGLLILLGAIVLVGDFVYDRLKGLQLIELKRDKVRYKYGQKIKLSYEPTFNLSNQESRLGVKLNFDFF